MAGNDAKIRLTAEDLTGAAFAAVSKNFGKLRTEAADLPAKFAQIAIASAGIASIAGFTSMISGAIEAKARLRDLSIQTNISVEALSGLAKVGKFTNTSIDDIASASNKLSKALFTQNEDSKGAAQAIDALGLNFSKFKTLAPEQQMLAVAKALDEFQDGSEKSAAAMLLFGKAGAQLLPFLKELAEKGLLVTKETAASALEAKKYEDNLKTLVAASDEWKKQLVNGILPALVETTRELVEGRKAYGGYLAAILDVGWNVNPFASQGANIATTRDKLKGYQDELAKTLALEKAPLTSLAGTLQSRTKEEIQADIDKLQSRYKYLLGVQQGQALDIGAGVKDERRFTTSKKKLDLPDATGKDKDADARALLKKNFDGQLKLIHDFAEQQRDAFAFANEYLKGVYDDGVISLADFFDRQRAVRDAGLKAELDAIDKEIAAAEAYKAKADKPQDRQDAENKIAEAVQKRAQVVQKAGQTGILSAQEEAKAVKALQASYNDFLANVKTLQGDEAGASAIRIARQVQEAQEQLTKVGFNSSAAKAQADAYGQLLTQTEALKRVQNDYSRLVEVAGLKEKNVQLDAQASGQSELETLQQIGAVRQDSLAALSALVDQARQLADALGTPESQLFAARLALQFKAASAEASPLLQKTRDLGKELADAFTNPAEEAILHWKGFRSLLSSIEQQVVSIATRELFTKPLNNYLGNLFGGNGQSSGGGGLLGQLLGAFGSSGSSYASLGGGAGNYNFGGGFAEGGTLQRGEWGIAGENGPERIYAGDTALQIMPNEDGQQRVTINQSFAITGPADKRTQEQIGAAAMAGAQRALRRNG